MNPSTASLSQPLRRLWWLQPAWLFAAVVGVTILAAAAQSDAAYFLYGTPKYVAGRHVLMAAVAIVVFAFGRRLAEATGRVPAPTPQEADRVVRFCFWLATGLTLFGYLVWLAVGIKNGFSVGMLGNFLTAEDPLQVENIRREVFINVKGITTCTQFGVAAVPLGLWLYFRGARGVFAPIVLLITLAAVRGFFLSERLALLELLIPGFVIVLRTRVLGRPLAPLMRLAWQVMPLLGVVSMLLLFGSFEYFRSWRYYQDSFDSYAEFTLWRIGGYYTTAHNNGAMALETQRPYPLPYATLRPLWAMPGLSSTALGYPSLTGVDPAARQDELLERYGTPEFNSEGGLFQPALDFGLAGFAAFWFGCGFVAGRLYRSYLVGALAGMTLFPLVFLSILETPRFLYLCFPRSLPASVTLVLVLWLVHRYSSQPSAADSAAAAT